jgi:hypothetical protein
MFERSSRSRNFCRRGRLQFAGGAGVTDFGAGFYTGAPAIFDIAESR